MFTKNEKPLYVILTILLGTVLTLFIVSCGANQLPKPESDSGENWDAGSRIPAEFVDDNVYEIYGIVMGDVGSNVRQSQAARGNVSGVGIEGTGYVSGSYYGPEFTGKGFVRVKVESITPKNDKLVDVGEVAILKTSDLKATAILVGDEVVFKCRAQYEAVAPIRSNETFVPEKVETWELDYCRLKSPKITIPE